MQQAFAEAEGLLGFKRSRRCRSLEKMPKLRATSTISVGYDNFDVDALTARILLMHTPTVLTETVADTLMALVLSTARRVVEVAERVKAGEWTTSIGPDWYGTGCSPQNTGHCRDGTDWHGAGTTCRTFGFNMPILRTPRRHHQKKQKNASTPATAI